MTDLRKLLQDADPVKDEGDLSETDAQRIRRQMLAAVGQPSTTFGLWGRPLAVAALMALIIGFGGVNRNRPVGHEVVPVRDAQAVNTPARAGANANDRRQLQFATPGGTRIIWVFDQNVPFQESMR
jgi:hypothetical protein